MGNITITIEADDYKTKAIAKFIKSHFKQFNIDVENNCGDGEFKQLEALLAIVTNGDKIVINKSYKKVLNNVKPTDNDKKHFIMRSVKNISQNNPVTTKSSDKKEPPPSKKPTNLKTPFDVAIGLFKYQPPSIPNPDEEIYVPLPGYVDDYEISNFGNIKSKARITPSCRQVRSKLLKISDNGYITLPDVRGSQNYNVSRLVYGTFKGKIVNEMRFVDNDKRNRKLSNLIAVH